MTYQSCVTAAISLLSAQVPSLVTVQDLEDRQQTNIPPDEAPALLLTESIQATETRIAGGVPGVKRRIWYLDGHLWAYYSPVAGSTSTFRALIEAVESAFRSHARLGGTADTATTQLLNAAEGDQGIRTTVTRPIINAGTAVRHALISVRLHELLAA